MIVDAHVHLLPERLASKIRRFFEERGAPPMPYPYAPGPPASASSRREIARCWSLPYAHRAGVAGPLNRWMAQTWAGDPLVVAGATVHPEDDVESVVAEAIEDLAALRLQAPLLRRTVRSRRRSSRPSLGPGVGERPSRRRPRRQRCRGDRDAR